MAEPIAEMDTQGKASVISYNVPEPTSYSGSHLIELIFPESYFNAAAKKIPEGRKVKVSDSELDKAVNTGFTTGFFRPDMFPNAGINRRLSNPAHRLTPQLATSDNPPKAKTQTKVAPKTPPVAKKATVKKKVTKRPVSKKQVANKKVRTR